jgi:hypothetical protein
MESLGADLPSWISWAVKPAAGLRHELANARDGFVGRVGEMKTAVSLRALLPSDCVLVNDVVLETSPEEFIQVDHVVVAKSGVYLVETKAWEGAVLCRQDSWMRKDGNRWVKCQSPIRQIDRHVRLFLAWLRGVLGRHLAGEWVHPLILFSRVDWLRAEESSVPVFRSPISMSMHIRKQLKMHALTGEEVDLIVASILSAKPLSAQPGEGS